MSFFKRICDGGGGGKGQLFQVLMWSSLKLAEARLLSSEVMLVLLQQSLSFKMQTMFQIQISIHEMTWNTGVINGFFCVSPSHEEMQSFSTLHVFLFFLQCDSESDIEDKVRPASFIFVLFWKLLGKCEPHRIKESILSCLYPCCNVILLVSEPLMAQLHKTSFPLNGAVPALDRKLLLGTQTSLLINMPRSEAF